jgi:hypothetical protein
MPDATNIEHFLSMPNLDVYVTAEAAVTQGSQAQLWHCHITACNTLGLLVHVYRPVEKDTLFLPWSSVLTIERHREP